jgi:drug/metabolite transporter (DMT)-like permease
LNAPPSPLAALASGTLFALAAGLLWGLVFIAPLLLPEYPAALLSASRYLAFGLIALPLAWWDRHELATLGRADWIEALKLSLVGNLLYYLFLAAAIQRAGGPLPTMIIGTLPVVIAVTSKLLERRSAPGHAPPLPWIRLLPSLVLLVLGIGLVNQAELTRLHDEPAFDAARYALGALLALGAVACWTWYPIRNARWLQSHRQHSSRAWATAQGLATLPLSAAGFGAFWAAQVPRGATAFPMPWGPDPALFIGLMFTIGLFGSWLGTLCWNAASQRLPTTLAGQLIVFETLAALTYAWALRGQWPDTATLLGAALLVVGVATALRAASRRPAAPPR